MATGRSPARKNPFDDDAFEEIHSSESSRIQSEKQLYEKRMLDSSKRSLILIEESKDIACKTEEELQSQEESLLRTEATLDKINGDIDIANRHITSLKSIWGTIGNYFRKPPPTKKEDVPPPPGKHSAETKQAGRKMANEPATSSSTGWEDKKEIFSSQPSNVNTVLDKNLDSMLSGLIELKGHALLLGDTLDRHDDIIDRVTYKATIADKRIEESDKNIRKILKK